MTSVGCALGLVVSLILGMFGRPTAHQPQPEPRTEPHTEPRGGPATSGVASWFATGPDGLYGAAGPALRHGKWRGTKVRVTSGARSVIVTLNDWCACGRRHGRPTVLDLSDEAFRRLAPLSRGVIRVEVEVLR